MPLVYYVEPKNEQDINGILKYLYDLHKDVYDKDLTAFQEVCNVEGTPGYGNWGDPWVTANPYYIGENISKSWSSIVQPYIFISYQLVNYYLKITHYAIRSRSVESKDMPKGWILFGSNDNKTWDVVDEEQNRNELLEINKIHTYNVSRQGIYKYFKLIVTENKRAANVLSFGKIDFFGKLYNTYPILYKTIKKQYQMKQNYLFILVFFIYLN